MVCSDRVIYLATMKSIALILSSLIVISIQVLAQPDLSDIRYEDYIYVDYIKSIKFNDGTSQLSDPITRMGSRLYLSFDDINSDEYQFNYMVIHCDRDWKPSDIDAIEYMEGFNYAEIRDPGESSRFTTVDYWHYRLTLPNRDVAWTVSGNYLLLVYDQDDNPVFSKRFVIYEGLGKLESSRGMTTGAGEFDTHQRIETVYIELPPDFLDDMHLPGLSLKTMQNLNWETLSEPFSPIQYQSDAFMFNSATFPSFTSLQDYRQCDTRALDFAGVNLLDVERSQDSIMALLKLNEPRRRNVNLSEFDMNGRFIVDQRDGAIANPLQDDNPTSDIAGDIDYEEEDRLNGEYAWTIFSINAELLPKAPTYVIGSFSDYKLYPEYELEFDSDRNIYIGAALMKQGRYDYHFVQIEDDKMDYTVTEKLDEKASQDYRTFVYYRAFGDEYDRVLNATFLKVNRDL